MTIPSEGQPERSKRKREESSTNLEPLTDVTAKNYDAAARMWIAANGNKGFMIARCECSSPHGQQFHTTKIEWGAWRAWFKWKRIKFNPKRDYYMVPTQWPEQFDAHWSTAQSQNAGSRYFDELLWEEKQQNLKPPNVQTRPML